MSSNVKKSSRSMPQKSQQKLWNFVNNININKIPSGKITLRATTYITRHIFFSGRARISGPLSLNSNILGNVHLSPQQKEYLRNDLSSGVNEYWRRIGECTKCGEECGKNYIQS